MPRSTLWRKWKRLAHRAARVQSHAVLFVVYFVVVVPMGVVRRAFGGRADVRAEPAWRPRAARQDDLASARRQF